MESDDVLMETVTFTLVVDVHNPRLLYMAARAIAADDGLSPEAADALLLDKAGIPIATACIETALWSGPLLPGCTVVKSLAESAPRDEDE